MPSFPTTQDNDPILDVLDALLNDKPAPAADPACCTDWQRGISAIDGCVALAQVHGGGYDGPPFRFCPWCGKAR